MKVIESQEKKINIKGLGFSIVNDKVQLIDLETNNNINLDNLIKYHFDTGDVLTLNLSRKTVDTDMK